MQITKSLDSNIKLFLNFKMYKIKLLCDFKKQVMSLKSLFGWAGGKRNLSNVLIDYVPDEYTTYIEPFFGAGSMFWKVQPQKAVINDANPWLMLIIFCVKNDVHEFVKQVSAIEKPYLKLKSVPRAIRYKSSLKKFNSIKDDITIKHNIDQSLKYNDFEQLFYTTAMFFFLIKRCYGGVVAFNSEGNIQCNVAKRTDLSSVNSHINKTKLEQASEYLNSINLKIRYGDYYRVCQLAKAGDFIYFDPPYLEVTSKIRYSSISFEHAEHELLCKRIKQLDGKNITFVLSGIYPSVVCDQLQEFELVVIEVRRTIGSMRTKLQLRNEMIIHN